MSKIQETGQHAAKKSDALFTRTREAGEAFVEEVRGASRDLVVFARTETKGWRRFLAQRTSQLKSEARALLTVPALERQLLQRVDEALRALDVQVRARLTALESGKSERKTGARAKALRKAGNGKRPARTSKSASSGAKRAAAGAANGVSIRH